MMHRRGRRGDRQLGAQAFRREFHLLAFQQRQITVADIEFRQRALILLYMRRRLAEHHAIGR
jgi:hypothetical protein